MDKVSRATTTPIGATPASTKNTMSAVPIAPRSSCPPGGLVVSVFGIRGVLSDDACGGYAAGRGYGGWDCDRTRVGHMFK
jgi:hypothetical protein